jgi:hypothetical protein
MRAGEDAGVRPDLQDKELSMSQAGRVLLAIIFSLSETGCSRLEHPVQAQALAPELVESAKAEVADIVKTLPSYRQDGLAAFEQPEIKTVESDLAMIQGDGQDREEGSLLVEEAKLLQADWEKLVALDSILQRENVV